MSSLKQIYTQVTPYTITTNYVGLERFSNSVTSAFSINRSGFDIMVYDVITHKSKSKVHLKIGDVEFKVLVKKFLFSLSC